ncbi:MAG: hypothetical protein JWR89_1668 [Tardiphaga sp.]|uniref:hypothetical protein n=1 Tax=Tardiphaga sp. TaxID=1926292 RepID=UPI002610872B|nr:hypothetical protein [Tardiphaga sp.]MDB5501766.1 hypothetical protein [Tardiphaga sp.]
MLKTVSGIALIAIAILLALQVFPVTGVFLMIFGGPVWTGMLVHIFLLALAIEGGLRRIPRAFIAIPLIAYGSYYVLYAYQTIDMAHVSAALRMSNSAKVIDFRADEYSLVTPAAQTLVSTHAIAVAYEPNANFQPEQHVAVRLIHRDQCKLPKDGLLRIQTSGVSFGNTSLDNACLLRFPEAPPERIVAIVKLGDEEIWKHKRGISTATSQLKLDGKVVGSFTTASVWRLPVLPGLAVGCGLISNPAAWKCGADFMRSHTVLDTVPDSIDRERFDGPESVMLGLPKYTAAGFRGYPENDATVAWLAGEPQRVEDRMFALMQDLAEGGYPKVPMRMGYTVAQNPARLAPLAEAMANRFIELSNVKPTHDDAQEYTFRYESLARALTALPDGAFAKVAAPLFAYFLEGMSRNQFPTLYARIQAASGAQTLDFYEADYMATRGYRRLMPVLAICRIGHASPAVIAEMKTQLLRLSDGPSSDDDSKTALIVTLLKLGEAPVVQDNKSHLANNSQPNFANWLDAVLAGKGTTAVGPNNCMTKDWNGRRATKPSLVLTEGVWIVPRTSYFMTTP